MKIFMDTSAFIALLVQSEESHPKVTHAYEEYKRKRALFLTSDYVLDELLTRMLYDFGKKFTVRVIKILEKAIGREDLKVLHIDSLLFAKALPLFTKYAEHAVSFTDITSVVLMRELKLDLIFTLDSDFKKLRINTSF